MSAELSKRDHNVIEVGHSNWLSVLHQASLSGHEIDCIINCAGYTGKPNVDACEGDKHSVYLANTIMPIEMLRYCESNNIKMVHFSSGCIYQGTINSVYAEPNFFGSTYAISKGISDNILKYGALVLRIRMPFSNIDEPKNFISKVYQYAKSGKLYNGGQNSLTNIDEAVVVACDLIEQKRIGPFNLVNKGSLDMQQIVDILKIQNPKWYTDDEFKAVTKCARSNCVIPAYYKMSDVTRSMTKCVNDYK